MYKNLAKLFVVASVALSSSFASYKTIDLADKAEGKVVGVRVGDVVNYLGNIVPSLSSVNSELLKNAERYMQETSIKEIHNLYFDKVPERSGSDIKLNLRAMVRLKSGAVEFKVLDVRYNSANAADLQVYASSYSINNTNFEFAVSLVDRKLTAYDRKNNTKMIFPLGVGSFDEGVLFDEYSLLTPRFKKAYLDKRVAEFSRKMPRYFKKKPFIRILTSENVGEGWTGIGFHVQPNLDTFVRAFDSHGCMRMPLDDLYTLYYLVDKSPTTNMPIEVSYRTGDLDDHPFPKQNKPYQRVVNVGSKAEPDWTLDRDNLVQTGKNWNGVAPHEELQDHPADDYHDMFNYSISDLVKAKQKEKEDACREETDNDKDYKKCLKSGKRKRTLKDKLYRWYIHGN
ncbi:L,D-transpeptidase catalytic domain protein [Bacteriovorax sp. BSW11_IV]|uniref:L,D-transpeptidase n=1 Tax=Bacteriovorax sp. BSW11_IV TaxID=1353529 RepID=UPI00038A5504|nr:L,D-transpeptidase [Bacteriovorax sp. BSW11_IV]EQC49282.1 L,D-transpeptidase catalytic domain protein [Bacteriovorax sp. BSW11_IV]